MKNRGLLSLILIAVMLLTLVVFSACGGGEAPPCTTHVDEDENLICDNCQADLTPHVHVDVNKDLVCDTCREKLEEEKINVTITVKGEDEAGVSGATITLLDGNDKSTSLTTNDQGVATAQLVAGNYYVSIENLPQYWYVDNNYSTIKVSSTQSTFDFVAIDNTPNGTEEKPFPAEDAETGEPASITFPANQRYTFITKSVVKRYLVINNSDAFVTYNGTEYHPEGGVIRVPIKATNSNAVTQIHVTNTLDSENTISLSFEAMEGTPDNPISVTYRYEHKVTISKGEQVYYKAIATQTGYIVVHCPTEFNNVSVSNLTSYEIAEGTRGGKATYVYAETGDEISICVELLPEAEDEQIEVSLTVDERQGTDFNQIVLYESEAFILKAGETLYFATGTPVSIELVTLGSVLLNGTDQTVLEGVDSFYVTNQGDADAEVAFVISYEE